MSRLYECDMGEGHHLYVVESGREDAVESFKAWGVRDYGDEVESEPDDWRKFLFAIDERTRGFDPLEYVEIPWFGWDNGGSPTIDVRLPGRSPKGSETRGTTCDGTGYIAINHSAEAHVWAAKLEPGVVLSVAP